MSGDALTMHGLANDEHERTVAFAKVALGQIRALRQPATPRNYRVWYTYATSYHPALNAAIYQLNAEFLEFCQFVFLWMLHVACDRE